MIGVGQPGSRDRARRGPAAGRPSANAGSRCRWCRASARRALHGSWPVTGPPRPPGRPGRPASATSPASGTTRRTAWSALRRAGSAHPGPLRRRRHGACRWARRHRPGRRVPARIADPGPTAADAVRGGGPGGLRAACRRHRRNATRIGLRDVGRDRDRRGAGSRRRRHRLGAGARHRRRRTPRRGRRGRADHRRPAVPDRPHLPAAASVARPRAPPHGWGARERDRDRRRRSAGRTSPDATASSPAWPRRWSWSRRRIVPARS